VITGDAEFPRTAGCSEVSHLKINKYSRACNDVAVAFNPSIEAFDIIQAPETPVCGIHS
jgi:hypothetical protein